MSRRTSRDRAREAVSYALSVGFHLLLLMTARPCVPEVPRLFRVQRLVMEQTLAEAERAGGLVADGSSEIDDDRGAASKSASTSMDEARDGRLDEGLQTPPPKVDAPGSDPPELDSEPSADPDRVEIVHTSAPGDRAADAAAESRYDQDAAPQSAPITSIEEGPRTAQSVESVSLKAARGDEASGSALSGGARAAGSTAIPSSSGGAASGVPAAPAPSWWAPRVSRVRPSPTTDGSLGEGETGVAETGAGDGLDPQVTRDATGELGKDEGSEEAPDELAADPDPELVDDQGEAVADAILEGEPEEGSVPTWDADAVQSASHQTVVDGPTSDAPAVSAAATIRGAWLQQVDDVVRKRWHSQDLPLHLQGIGVRGETAVRFTIAPNGRTSGVEIIRKSGNAWLDALAKEAIPPRVPRMPRELPDQPLSHEITFGY